MASYLSPSVIVKETDLSQVVEVSGNNITVFAGNFKKGPVGVYEQIGNVGELRRIYGDPTKENINDFMQCYNFLQYSNTLLVSRAADLDGTLKKLKDVTYEGNEYLQEEIQTQRNIQVYKVDGDKIYIKEDVVNQLGDQLQPKDVITFGNDPTRYKVKSLKKEQIQIEKPDPLNAGTNITENVESDVIVLDSPLTVVDPTSVVLLIEIEKEEKPKGNFIVLKGNVSLKNGDIVGLTDSNIDPLFRVLSTKVVQYNNEFYTNVKYIGKDDDSQIANGTNGNPVYILDRTQGACAEVSSETGTVYSDGDYNKVEHTIANYRVFDEMQSSLPFVNNTAKLKIFAKTPGSWGNMLEVAIASHDDFGKAKECREGVALDDIFEYTPLVGQYGIMIFEKGNLVESYTVSLDESAKDDQNNSLYIENVINQKSDYVRVNVNEANPNNTLASSLKENIINLYCGSDSTPGEDDIIEAYNVFENKEEVEIDIILSNEKYPQAAAELAIKREDCVAFLGAPKEVSVGLKATEAARKTTEWRTRLNYNNRHVAYFSNYKYQYSPDLDKPCWINLVGDIGGIYAKSTFDNGSAWAAAGLNRGVIRNVDKLAVSFAEHHRDTLYKNQVNPIVTFPNQGSVIWGQKTSQTKNSSFNRINVVRIFKEMERALSKMSKYSLFEFNDAFTRNYLTSIIRPYLAGKKADRSIIDSLVVCDETNNTPQVIANNQLVCDIFIKPNYSAEWIILHFVNVGTNDFSIAVTGA